MSYNTPSTELYTVFKGSTLIAVNAGHLPNASSPIEIRFSGISISTKLRQSQKTDSPILSNDEGSEIVVKS